MADKQSTNSPSSSSWSLVSPPSPLSPTASRSTSPSDTSRSETWSLLSTTSTEAEESDEALAIRLQAEEDEITALQTYFDEVQLTTKEFLEYNAPDDPFVPRRKLQNNPLNPERKEPQTPKVEAPFCASLTSGEYTCLLCDQLKDWVNERGDRTEVCVSGCRHLFCKECLKKEVRTQLEVDKIIGGVRCPAIVHGMGTLSGIGAFIPIELAQEIGLSDADVERWKICVVPTKPPSYSP